MVATKERSLLSQLVADMIRSVAGGVHAFKGPSVPVYNVSVLDLDVGNELRIRAFLHDLVTQDSTSSVGAKTVRWGIGELL